MKNKLLSIALIAISSFSFAQQGKSFWKSTTKKSDGVPFENKIQINNPKLFELDVNLLKQALINSPKRFSGAKNQM